MSELANAVAFTRNNIDYLLDAIKDVEESPIADLEDLLCDIEEYEHEVIAGVKAIKALIEDEIEEAEEDV